MREHTGRTAVLTAATVASGLMAGVFYTFSVAIMIGLGHSSDRTFVEAMQDINEYIVNGWFMLAFLGALALPALAAFLQYRSGEGRRTVLPWIVAGFVLYGVAFLITGGVEIPLNDQLADAGAPDRIRDLAAVRDDFESRWIAWNAVRTLAGTAGFVCLSLALIRYGRETRDRAVPVSPPATRTLSRSW